MLRGIPPCVPIRAEIVPLLSHLIEHRLEIREPLFGQGCPSVGIRQPPSVNPRYGSFPRLVGIRYVGGAGSGTTTT